MKLHLNNYLCKWGIVTNISLPKIVGTKNNIENTDEVKEIQINMESSESIPTFTRQQIEVMLWQATDGKELEILKNVVTQDTNLLHSGDSGGNTLLHKAAEAGNKEFLAFLLEKGANVNAKNSLEQTALHIAVRNNREDITRLLLDKASSFLCEFLYNRTSISMVRILSEVQHSTQLVGYRFW
jgi:ankyrin repeat protein